MSDLVKYEIGRLVALVVFLVLLLVLSTTLVSFMLSCAIHPIQRGREVVEGVVVGFVLMLWLFCLFV